METYEFASLSYYNELQFMCTDIAFSEKITQEIKEMVPKLHVIERPFPSGEIFGRSFYNFGKGVESRDFLWWIITELCASGWEPLGSGPNPEGIDAYPAYNFRRLVST